MKRTLLSVKEVAQELVSYRIQHAPVRSRTNPEIFQTQGLARIVRPRSARSAAPAADVHSKRPRLVKRGRNF